jgi:GNAT superfamily N-acetyltransferase
MHPHRSTNSVQKFGPLATVRSVYVHPAMARRGIARQIMATVETGISAAGFRRVSLAATLVGIPFYRRLGYRGCRPVISELPRGLLFVGLDLCKHLAKPTDLGLDAAA